MVIMTEVSQTLCNEVGIDCIVVCIIGMQEQYSDELLEAAICPATKVSAWWYLCKWYFKCICYEGFKVAVTAKCQCLKGKG